MALPFFVAAVAAGARAVGPTLASAFGSVIVAAATNPATRLAQATANDVLPNIYPGVSEIIHTNFIGNITYSEARKYLRYSGVNWSTEATDPGRPHIWDRIFDAQRPWYSPAEAAQLYHRKQVEPRVVREAVRRAGLAHLGYAGLLVDARTPLGVSEAIQLHRQGDITDLELEIQLNFSGYRLTTDKLSLQQLSTPPATGELLNLLNRGKIDEEAVRRYWRIAGVVAPATQDELLTLRYGLPSPSDLIYLAVKDVWDPQIVQAFGYDEEFPKPFQYWMKKVGMDWTEDVPVAGGQAIQGVPWPKAFWRAHWQVISPQQAYSMLHRLRPNRVANWAEQGFQPQPFLIQDVRDILKTADYPPAFRDRLAALSYHQLGRIDVQRLFRRGIIDRGELVERFQDDGYTRPDAERLTQWVEFEVNLSRYRKTRGLTRGKVIESYQIGLISYEEAAVGLYELSIEQIDTLDRYNALDAVGQAATAVADPNVRAALAQADFDERLKLVKRVINEVGKAFRAADLNEAQATEMLANSGLRVSAAERYIKSWNVEKVGHRKRLTASKILQMYENGLVSQMQAYTRLGYLGYSDPDSVWLTALVNQKVTVARAKAAERSARSARQRQAAQIAAIKAARRDAKATSRRLAGGATQAQLLRWLKKGLVGEVEVRRRLALVGQAPADIDRMVEEALAPPPPKKTIGSGNGQTQGPAAAP